MSWHHHNHFVARCWSQRWRTVAPWCTQRSRLRSSWSFWRILWRFDQTPWRLRSWNWFSAGRTPSVMRPVIRLYSTPSTWWRWKVGTGAYLNLLNYFLICIFYHFLMLKQCSWNTRTDLTFLMARPKCLIRDFTNLNRIYKAHRTNVWWFMKVFRVPCWNGTDSLKSLLMENKDIFIMQGQFHIRWWPMMQGHQGISNLDHDLVLLEYFSFSTWRVNMLRPEQNNHHFANDVFKCIFSKC